jgi:HD-GYP domain-containing protein (c-di-GMP phosphodiesterase class II)
VRYREAVSRANEDAPVRLAELVAALSLGIDLGFGQPMEHVLRQCLIALRLAERMSLREENRATVYYTALLINVGCHSDAHEQAKWFGDDLKMKSGKYTGSSPGRGEVPPLRGLLSLGDGHSPLHRFRLGLEFILSGHRELSGMISHHAAISRALAEQLALSEAVQQAVGSSYERWDGRGWPGKLGGAEIPIAARISPIAEFVEVAYRVGGIEAVKKLARERRGAQFDPGICDLLLSDGETLLAGIERVEAWDKVIASEPALEVVLSGHEVEAALTALANFVDLKSPYFLGHARAVSALAAEAGTRAGMGPFAVALLRRAGLVHGFGRLGISNAILDKRGPLGAGERERARMQPYLTERMLCQSQALGPTARLAVQHRERIDGSGYPRGLAGAAIAREARFLAAADAYQSMREPRPHRIALSAEQAALELRSEVKSGRHDAEAVDAVLAAAGHRVTLRRDGPAGLTLREVEVLRHLARGLSNKEIAARLFISSKTVSNHVEHIYGKIGATNRAAAGLFAMQHGLLPEEEFPVRIPAAAV